ncbi:O-antigen ligase family protein [Patescibacteria group bacterium]|nr:O-antigen ligase family protein [Patescibacteria group bacterium]
MISWLTLLWVLSFIYLAVRHPDKIPFALVLVLPTYLIKFWVLGIPTTWLELAIYAVFIVWLVQHRQNYPKFLSWWSVYKVPLILLGISLGVGLAVSTQIIMSLGIIKGWFIDPLLLAVILVSSKQQLKHVFIKVSTGLVIAGLILSVVAIYQVVTGNFITLDQRASAWFTSANYLSLFLVPIIVLGWGLFNQITQQRQRIGLVIAEIVMVMAVYFTMSYAGWLALLISGLIFWVLVRPRWVNLWWWGLGASLVVASQWQHPKFQQMLDLIGRSSSHVRLQVWQTALLMIQQHWLTGIGLGLFEQRYLEFANQIFHPPIELIMLHSHNIFLQFWLNLGIVGLVGFIWLLAIWFKLVWSFVMEHNMIAITIVTAMVALLVHGMLDVAYWKNDLSALFWIIFALGIMVHGQKLSYRD